MIQLSQDMITMGREDLSVELLQVLDSKLIGSARDKWLNEKDFY